MFPGKPTGNLLPSLLGGTPRMAIPLGYHFPGAPNPIVPECTLWSTQTLTTHPTTAQDISHPINSSVRPPTAGPKKHLYPFSGALYLCPLKYHLGRDSPTNSKKPLVLAQKYPKNDPPRGGSKYPKNQEQIFGAFFGDDQENVFSKNPK